MKKIAYALLLPLLGAASTCAFGSVIASDDFSTNATVTNVTSFPAGSQPGNMAYTAHAATLSVASGTLTNGATSQDEFVGVFPGGDQLLNVGDSIQLTFSYHLAANPAARTSGVPEFGLFHGPSTVSDNFTTGANGYFGSLGITNTASNYPATIGHETTGSFLLAGTNQITDATTSPNPYSATDTTVHNVTFTVTRSSLTLVTISDSVDGYSPLLTSGDATLFTNFNEVGFRNDAAAVVYDNIKVQYLPVPEPTSLGLLALAGVGLLKRRRASR